MSVEELIELFRSDELDGEYLRFDRVENRRSQRADIHAFLLLDSLVPGKSDMVGGAGHDEIFLSVSAKELAPVVTLKQLIELRRSGVRYCPEHDCLAMFV